MDFYCDLFKKGFHRSDTHHCAKTCQSCMRLNCAKDLRNMRCTQCKIYYNNETCLRLHDSHFCKAKTTCKDCGNKKMYYHVCGDNQHWCNVCKKSVPLAGHQCFIKKEKIEDTKRTCQGYIFFDYKCTVVENKHIPNLIMARKVLLNPNNFEQYTVDAEMYTFRTNNSFCKWLIKHEDFIAIAHNMKGYDGAFIFFHTF